MTTATTAPGGALRLWAEISARYGSLDAFLEQLHREIDAPTQELPRLESGTCAHT
ncbi:hypothetical protein [Nocardia huaxiensis]|uniref:Uncharacterized protein n=1 Tax=Nocardia huaxiensis TaxID=2755382 RepID=A0A7D6ZGQ2_9NOCA|nr:hypothetical protein [Nocardia huaxiensis]QLY30459.1 hypothetical protein H0264_35990 [Nocardia huaxiensis]UFS95941.1 hypothetical protein LPY97_35690 [Nocardia huaxiensis]